MGLTDPQATARHDAIEDLLTNLADLAERTGQRTLGAVLDALRRVHGLYPEADALAERYTPQHRARIDIHNQITAAFADYLDTLEPAPEESSPGEPAA